MTSHNSQNCKKMAYVEKICSVDLYSVEKAVEKLSMLCKILIYSYMFSLYYKSIEIHICGSAVNWSLNSVLTKFRLCSWIGVRS